jgi:hypothetical protein
MLTRPQRRAAIVALVAAVALAGCGSGGRSSTPTATTVSATTTAKPPSKAQFMREGDAVCLKLAGRAAKAFEQRTKDREAHPDRVQTQQQELEEVNLISMPGFEQQAHELGELVPPKGDENEIKAIVTAFEDGVTSMRQNANQPLNTSKESPFFHADELARAYGFKVCGH